VRPQLADWDFSGISADEGYGIHNALIEKQTKKQNEQAMKMPLPALETGNAGSGIL
jgi:hypothetical protein